MNHTGEWGENIVESILSNRGCEILARNYRMPGGELDIVIRSKQRIYLIEVRTREVPEIEGYRADLTADEIFASITSRKLHALQRSMRYWLASTGQPYDDFSGIWLAAVLKASNSQKYVVKWAALGV